MPRHIVDKLQAEVAKASRSPEVLEKFEQLGITVTASTPGELADFVKVETAKWARIIQVAGIKPE